jgi:hypothetical protein
MITDLATGIRSLAAERAGSTSGAREAIPG